VSAMLPAFKKERLQTIVMTLAAVLALFACPPSVSSQEEKTPALELEEYQIIGRDTRVFSITGDALPIMKYEPIELALPGEERTANDSLGLIGESERARLSEQFLVTRGPNLDLEYMFGANSTNDLYGKLGYNAAHTGASVRFTHRSASEDTPANLSPLAQDAEILGYLDTEQGDVAVTLGFTRQDDDAIGSDFRPGSRALDRFRAGVSFRREIMSKWQLDSKVNLMSGTYDELVAGSESDEFSFDGSGEATTEMFGGTVGIRAELGNYEVADNRGSALNTGASGSWLFGGRLATTLGARISASSMPDDNTELHLYPYASFDLSITPSWYLRADFNPRLVTCRFADMYDMNGMATLTAPLLYEHRPVDLSGEAGMRLSSGLGASLAANYIKAEDTPVFSRTVAPGGDTFYDIIAASELTRRTVTAAVSYKPKGTWSLAGSVSSHTASWNFSGSVPFIPDMEALLAGEYVLADVWTFRTIARYYGKHHLERGSGDSAKGFLTVDIGAERTIYRDNFSAFTELRNLTGSSGSWWSAPYRVPDIGMYIGVRGHY
jgi:hypothetical protein